MNKISVLIVDDHTILREGLRSLLNQKSDIEVISEADNGQDAIKKVNELNPDIIIMDLDMPVLNGVDSTRIICKEHPGSKIIILSMYPDHEYVQASLTAGACGFVVKETAADELIEAVRLVNQGKAYFSPSVSKLIIESKYKHDNKENDEVLTQREREVLQLIAEGAKSKQIASKLFISEATVMKHRANIMEKLDIHDLASLIRYAIQKKIISDKRPNNL